MTSPQISKREKMQVSFSDRPYLQSAVFAALVLFVATAVAFIWVAHVYYRKKLSGLPGGNELYLECAYFSEIGKRPSQQDSVFISSLDDYRKYGITALVADGMGGMRYGGEIAQKVADFVEGMCPMSFFATEQNADILRSFSNELYEEYKLQGGSTLALVNISGNYMNYYSVGDSDIILIRDGTPTILNPRQNYMTLLIKSLCRNNKTTQTAYTNAKAKALIDFMGNQDPKVIYTRKPIRIFDGDKIIVSSDGLTDAVSLRHMKHYIKDSASVTATLLKRAVAGRKRPKQDNYTAIVFSVKRGYL